MWPTYLRVSTSAKALAHERMSALTGPTFLLVLRNHVPTPHFSFSLSSGFLSRARAPPLRPLPAVDEPPRTGSRHLEPSSGSRGCPVIPRHCHPQPPRAFTLTRNTWRCKSNLFCHQHRDRHTFTVTCGKLLTMPQPSRRTSPTTTEKLTAWHCFAGRSRNLVPMPLTRRHVWQATLARGKPAAPSTGPAGSRWRRALIWSSLLPSSRNEGHDLDMPRHSCRSWCGATRSK
jgi:hypothetical protein